MGGARSLARRSTRCFAAVTWLAHSAPYSSVPRADGAARLGAEEVRDPPPVGEGERVEDRVRFIAVLQN